MRPIFMKVSCGVGMEYTLVMEGEAMTDEELTHYAWMCAVECANTYGTYVSDEDEYDEDELYSTVFTEDCLEYQWEPYDPEKHDQYRCGGGSFQDEIKTWKSRVVI